MPKKSVEQIVDDAIKPVLGVSIGDLNKDISEKLEKSPLAAYEINTNIKFKDAKKQFKQQFLRKLLRVSYGNISEVAKKAGVDRRSIHRIVKDAGINVSQIREEMIKPYQVKQKAVGDIVEDVLEHYKQIIHPSRIAEVYKNVGNVSKDILDELPLTSVTLKKAEENFERQYLKQALEENNNKITVTAKKIGLRYETLLRKMKNLRIRGE
ncbi:hypothetical protein HQ545_04235 [Candidatus Woesearchaeota archaeon]|nr:hypothetical protein [Candidatus Woesearchaeota archaeon]